ncbi:hypothetical protein L1987_84593 [Smallanthus sonchifolius]|uniref:Uncharacterized protein n=1 Tax=Smallanthus sonchifolius TaxID=185202 RepID=A0ACB8XU24_9ASTR|nr:hypothetical protein L1987_84593 [Smallanthus sonchifolius]
MPQPSFTTLHSRFQKIQFQRNLLCKFVSSLRIEINQDLATIQDIASGKHLQVLLLVSSIRQESCYPPPPPPSAPNCKEAVEVALTWTQSQEELCLQRSRFICLQDP